ncbi:MAG: hypothetical protein CMJ77_23545 [Planctomycetaceae bacterium]|nr:hypothetical protein [Planctomycetaceae bacterium]
MIGRGGLQGAAENAPLWDRSTAFPSLWLLVWRVNRDPRSSSESSNPLGWTGSVATCDQIDVIDWRHCLASAGALWR